MATVKELFDSGVRKIRREPWNEFAHIELTQIGDHMGPWVTLRDLSGDPAAPLHEEKMFCMMLDNDDWEAWPEIPCPWEK